MYNGIEAAKVKGTGLSGYTQRSRATLNVTNMRQQQQQMEGDDAALEGGQTINPLLQMRTQKENEEMAQRLASHRAIREVKLKIFLYREERAAKGTAPEVLERECDELYRSLMATVEEAQRARRREEEMKTAERFAEAFGVKSGAGGSRFDRAATEEEKRQQEAERRQQRERQLVERLKKARQEAQQ